MENPVKSFEDLEVWQTCSDLRRKLGQMVRKLPSDEKFRLIDQIIRAARSSTNNIAEGYGRFHYQENIQFCRQSRGSLYELIDHLHICLDEKYLERNEFETLREECLRAIQMLNGFMRYLQKKKNEGSGDNR
jgi:four helix bundle protein